VPTDEAEFSQAFRGYDREEVDKTLQGLRRDLITANVKGTEAGKEVKRLVARIDELNAEIEEVGSPTYSGLGTKLENTLRVAEEQSTRVIAQADIDAEKLRVSAAAEFDKVRRDATEQAERILSDASVKAARMREEVRSEVDGLLERAQDARENLLQDAVQEAALIRGAVATEAAEVRATVKREAAAIRSEAEREAAGVQVVARREATEALAIAAGLTLETELARAELANELEQLRADSAAEAERLRIDVGTELAAGRRKGQHDEDRLNREIGQARADIEVELTVRRDEAEQEHLALHHDAVAQTQKYLDDATRQLAETNQRTQELRALNEELGAEARAAAKAATHKAEDEADRIVHDATVKAGAMVREAEERTRALVADAEGRLGRIRIEQGAVAGYFESLRSVLTQAERVTSTDV
jgi:DivIVA domain-containing protein